MIGRFERNAIPTGPSIKRTVQMGRCEYEHARCAVEYRSSMLVFGGITLTRCNPPNLLAKLPQALLVLQKLHPVLRCRLGFARGEYVFEEDPTLRIAIKQYARPHGMDTWKQIWGQDFECMETKLQDATLRVCFVCNENEDQCDILIALGHYACDGTSFGFLLDELLTHIANETTINDVLWGKWETCVDEDALLRQRFPNPITYFIRDWTQHIKSLACNFIPGIVPMPQHVEHEGLHLFRTAKQLVEESQTHLRMWDMPSAPLLARCRMEKCTVTAAVTSAFLCAQQELIGNHGGVTIQLSFSTRELCGNVGNRLLSPYIGSMPTILYPCEGNSFAKYTALEAWDLARQIRKWSSSVSEVDRLLLAKRTMDNMAFCPLGNNVVRYPNLVVSSWGSSAIKRKYGGGQVQVERGIFAQNHRYISMPLLSMNNMVEGRLCLVFLTPKPRIDPALSDAVFDRAVQKLEEMIATCLLHKL